MPQAQQQQQQQNHWTHGQASAGVTSSTTMFGGLGGPLKDQEWWLRDSSQILAHWNGYDQPANLATTGAGYSSNIYENGGDGVTNGMAPLTGSNGLGNGMYSTSAYGFPPMGDNSPL